MVAAIRRLRHEEEQHVVLRAMSWQDFEAILAVRGERAGVRMYYLDGEIELVSSTKIHEGRKKKEDARPAGGSRPRDRG